MKVYGGRARVLFAKENFWGRSLAARYPRISGCSYRSLTLSFTTTIEDPRIKVQEHLRVYG